MDPYRSTFRKSLSPTERVATIIDFLPREVRDIALSYAHSKYGETALDAPFTEQELHHLLTSTDRVLLAYFYREGCRVNGWQVKGNAAVVETVVSMYKSAAIGETPGPAFQRGDIEHLIRELQRNPPRVEMNQEDGRVYPTVLLDVASMFFLFRQRAESFPSPTSLARWRTHRFLNEVTDYYDSAPELLEQYLRESAIALALEVPARAAMPARDAVVALDAMIRDAVEGMM